MNIRTGFKTAIIGLSSLSIGLLIVGCGGGAKQQSVLDTPQSHYETGKRYLDREDYESALRQFEQSKSLDKDYVPAYEGLALANLGLGNYDEAKKAAFRGLDIDDDYAPLYVARGEIYFAQGKYDDAKDEFKKAKKKDKSNLGARVGLGKTYVYMEDYEKAREEYEEVLVLDPTNMDADRELEELSRFSRAMAGQPPEYRAIAKSEAITRAELAALYVNELPLDRIFRKAPETKQAEFIDPTAFAKEEKKEEEGGASIADVSDDHWAFAYIEDVVRLGLMETGPDNTFAPDIKVSKMDFAMLIQSFLEKALNDPSLPTKYFGTTSPFADISGSHFAFNAVMTASSRGIIPGKTDGTFGISDPVSGTDALLILKRLKEQFEL